MNREYSHLLPLVAEARIYRDRNNWWTMDIKTKERLDVNFKYTFSSTTKSGVSGGCFIGTDLTNSVVSCFMHSGGTENEKGFGGMTFDLDMKDGTTRTIKGPWSGRPSVHMEYGAPDYLEVTQEVMSSTPYPGRWNIGLSVPFVCAIINKFDLNFNVRLVEFYDEWHFDFEPNN